MAKSQEQKVIDAFYSATGGRFEPAIFAHLMSQTDSHTQTNFFYCMAAYIKYQAIQAEYNPSQAHQLSRICVSLRDTLDQTGIA